MDELLSCAFDNLVDGRVYAAERAAGAAVTIDPANPDAWQLKGLVLQARRHEADARDAYERSLALREDAETWYLHALTVLDEFRLLSTCPAPPLERYVQATESLRRAARMGHRRARALLQVLHDVELLETA